MQINSISNGSSLRFGDLSEWNDGSAHLDPWSRDPGDAYFPSSDDDNYSASKEPSWSKNLLKITFRSPQELYDIGEYFHEFDNMQLLGVCTEAYILTPWKIPGAYNKLKSAVEEVKQHREEMQETLNKILSASKNTELSMLKQGEKIIDKEFTEKIQTGETPANGFFVFGNSEKKEGIATHLYVDVKYDVKPIEVTRTFNENDIEEIYNSLHKFALSTMKKNTTSNLQHGIFIIDNFDLFLNNPKTKKEREIQEKFHNFMQNCAAKYKTTVVGISNKYTDTKLQSSASSDKFIPIEVSSGKKASDEKLLKKIQDEISRLDNKALQVYNRFRE